MKKRPTNSIEQDCPICNGTGFEVLMQPVQPGRRIYPPPCKECGGKGRIPRSAGN
jgi:DnaJ-class molecular chaperone